jgi:hypothetical protein
MSYRQSSFSTQDELQQLKSATAAENQGNGAQRSDDF